MLLPKVVQVEVTTACQLRCVFCARTVLKDQWVSTHLDWTVFSSLLPFLRKTMLVHLQGWGEPLLHPRLWDMAAAVKQKGGRVSLTTNAVTLDEVVCREACRIDFDLIAISIAGATAKTNDSLRLGSHFDQICANISYLCSLKRRPKVHLIMQMMKPNMEELPEVVTLAKRLGVDKVIFPNLDYIPNSEVAALKAFALSPDPHYAELTEEAKRRGKELGIMVHIYPLAPRYDVLMCDAEPIHNIWVTVWGEVAPCPYVALACRGDFPRFFWGKEELLPRFSFGKITEGLDHVLRKEKARSFREAFSFRLKTGSVDVVTDVVSSLPKLWSSSVRFLKALAEMTYPKGTIALPPPPTLCRNCYKLYGI